MSAANFRDTHEKNRFRENIILAFLRPTLDVARDREAEMMMSGENAFSLISRALAGFKVSIEVSSSNISYPTPHT